MGAYAYCAVCGSGMDVPNLEEAVLGAWRCPSCGSKRQVCYHNAVDALQAFESRVAELERLLETAEGRFSDLERDMRRLQRSRTNGG